MLEQLKVNWRDVRKGLSEARSTDNRPRSEKPLHPLLSHNRIELSHGCP